MTSRQRCQSPKGQTADDQELNEDNCCCSCLKPKSKPSGRNKKQNEEDAAPKQNDGNWHASGVQGKKEHNNRSYTNALPDSQTKPSGRAEWSREKRGITKGIKYIEPDPKETAKHGAANADQENSDGKPRNMKPSLQNKTSSSPVQSNQWSMDQREDNGKEEIKKNGKSTGSSSADVTKNRLGHDSLKEQQKSDVKPSPQNKTISSPVQGNQWSMDQREDNRKEEIKKNGKSTSSSPADLTKNRQGHYSLKEHQKIDVPKTEDNNGSHGGTRPDPTKKQGKGNNGSHGGIMSDPTKKTVSSTFEQAGPPSWKENENNLVKHSYKDPLEDQQKGVQNREYNREIHRDTGPDHTKKESSPGQAGVPRRIGKQTEANSLEGINTNDEYTGHNPSATIASKGEQQKDFSMREYSN
ncbi:hypothetical protein ACOSQ3_022413 [Xanthoceras sorbifolium]